MELPVVERWFSRRDLDGGITLLREPHVHPLLRCNIWHITGKSRDLLVDTGLGIGSLRKAAADIFRNPLTVLATHFHNDHVGGMAEFGSDERAIHENEAAELRSGADGMALTLGQLGKELVACFSAAGYRFDSECLLDAVPNRGFNPADHRLEPIGPTFTVREGDVLDLGDRAFEVIHLPGHSAGSIGLWEAATGLLLAGDAIYDGPLLDNLPESDGGSYSRTMERLLSMPVRYVLPGHGEPFGAALMKDIAQHYLESRSQTGVAL